MHVRTAINCLNNVEKFGTVYLPLEIITDNEFPGDVFLLAVSNLLKDKQPQTAYINHLPLQVDSDVINKFLQFLAKHSLQKINFDFSQKDDAWIQSFYDAARLCYRDHIGNKPELRCAISREATENWDEKFRLLNQPPVLTPIARRVVSATDAGYLRFINAINPPKSSENKENRTNRSAP